FDYDVNCESLTCHTSHMSPPIAVILLFFLQCSVHLLDLHSFPTRRSSDLGRLLRISDKIVPFEELHGDIGHVVFLSGVENPDDVDRKSTRLNSSHLGISYAVFCLKKKNINTDSSVISK